MGKRLVYFIGDNNEECLYSIEYEKPEEILFLYNEKREGKYKTLKDYIINRNNKIKSSGMLIRDNITEIFDKYLFKDDIIDISSADSKNSIELLYYGINNNIPVLYVDINEGTIVKYLKDEVIREKVEFSDLNVDEVMDSSGAKIIFESTDIGNEKVIYDLTMMISRNMVEWSLIRDYIMNNSIINNEAGCAYRLDINTKYLKNENRKLVNSVLNILKRYNQISFQDNHDKLSITFKNNIVRGFLFKAGSWFEVFTKIIIEDIDFIDDVKCGVLFQWDKAEQRIKNEIDVVAVRNGVLICISCKDSCKYDEDALNELNVYAEKIGGENVVKILAATKEPVKSTVIKRAKEMDIGVVIYKGNKEKFKKELIGFIEEKTNKDN